MLIAIILSSSHNSFCPFIDEMKHLSQTEDFFKFYKIDSIQKKGENSFGKEFIEVIWLWKDRKYCEKK